MNQPDRAAYFRQLHTQEPFGSAERLGRGQRTRDRACRRASDRHHQRRHCRGPTGVATARSCGVTT